MFILSYSKNNRKGKEVEERLRQMSLAFKTEETKKSDSIVLKEGKKEVMGFEAINDYLNELNGELHHWYYCNC